MQTANQIAAEYTAPTKRQSGWLRITEIANGRRNILFDFECDGKVAARRIAANYGATPWNF